MTTTLVLWLPGALINPLNVGGWGLWKHRRWARTRREQAAERARVALLLSPVWREIDPAQPKRVELHAVVPRRFDQDGLRAALKPALDGLRDARLIHSDGPECGHDFVYRQRGSRIEPPGVSISISVL